MMPSEPIRERTLKLKIVWIKKEFYSQKCYLRFFTLQLKHTGPPYEGMSHNRNLKKCRKKDQKHNHVEELQDDDWQSLNIKRNVHILITIVEHVWSLRVHNRLEVHHNYQNQSQTSKDERHCKSTNNILQKQILGWPFSIICWLFSVRFREFCSYFIDF